MNRFWMSIVSIFFGSLIAVASPQTLNLNGRLLKADNTPLTYNAVSFSISVLDPAGSCVLYTETISPVDMTSSDGYFSIKLGSGTRSYPGSGLLFDFFKNSGTFTCDGSGSYSPLATDSRKVRVEFNDGSVWNQITPDMSISSVPYAEYSKNADSLGGYSATDYVRTAGIPSCLAGEFLTFDGTSLSCSSPAAFSGVTSITAGTGLTGGTISTSGTIALANTSVTAGSYGSATEVASFSVDAQGRLTSAGNITVTPDWSSITSKPTTLAGYGITDSVMSNTLATAKIWVGNGLNQATAVTVTGDATLDGTGQLALISTGVASGTYAKVTVDTKGRVTAGSALAATDIPNLDAAKITSGTLTTDVSSTNVVGVNISGGNGSFTNLKIYDGVSKYLTFNYPTGGSGYSLIWPANQGSAGQVLQNDGSGNLSWAAQASAPVTSVAGRTGAVTLSNTDISGLGTAATRNVPAAGDAATAEVVLGNDSRLTDSRLPSGSAGGDLSGSYPNPSVVKIQGRPVDGTLPLDGQVMLWDTSSWKPQYVRMQDIRNAWGGTQMIPATTCASSEAMVWSVVTDRFSCQSIGSLDAAVIASGTLNTARIPDLDAAKITTGVIATAHLGSGTADVTSYLRGDGTWSTLPSPTSLQVSPGSAAAPSISFTDSSNTGIYSSSSGVFAIAASGTQVFGLSNSSASLYKPLHLQGGSGASTYNSSSGAMASPFSSNSLSLSNGTFANNSAALATFKAYNTGGNSQSFYLGAISTSVGNSPAIVLGQQTGATAYEERLRIDENGNLAIGTTAPALTAIVDISSTSKGFLIPRMTTAARDGIFSPATGLQIYNTSTNSINFYNGASWQALGTAGAGVTSVSSVNTDISVANGTTSPSLTLNSGISGGSGDANKIAKLDGGGLLATGMIPNLDTSMIASGVLPVDRGGTGSGAALSNNRIMVSGGGNIVAHSAITANRALASNTNGLPVASTVTATELDYLSGVTSGIQTQLNSKASSTSWSNFSVITTNGTGTMQATTGSTTGTILQYSPTGPVYSTATYPSTTASNQLLYSSANNVVGGLPSSNNAVLLTNASGTPAWSAISNDNFTHYALLAGRAGGQILNGGNAAGNDLTLESTSNATKGSILLNPSGGNVGVGTNTPAARLDVAGAVRVGADGTACSPALAGGIRYNSGNVEYCNGTAWAAFAAGGSGITSLGGLSAATQSFAVGTAGTSPAFSSATSTHTLNIPMASTAGTTAGLISKSEYDTFNNKFSASVTTPASGQFIKYNGSAWVNSAISAATDISGVLPVANGGTGASSLAAGNLLIGNGTSALGSLAAGVSGNIVYSTGVATWNSGSPDTAGVVDKSTTQTITGAKAFSNYIFMNAQNELRLGDASSAKHVALRGPSSMGSNVTLTMPGTAGSSGQVLSTNGSGDLSWVSTVLTTGRPGGQVINGGTAPSENLTLDSTLDSTKGNILLAPTGGNVGIGTSTPGAALDIASTSVTGVALYLRNAAAASTSMMLYNSNTSPNASFALSATSTSENSNNYFSIRNSTLTNIFTLNNIGQASLGQTVPRATLHVERGTVPGTVNAGGVSVNGTSTTFQNDFKNGDKIIIGGEVRTVNNIYSNTSLDVTTSFNQSYTSQPYAKVAAVIKGGNLGVGTDGPRATLDVVGDSMFQGKMELAAISGSTTSVSGTTINGVDTKFTKELKVGDLILINNQIRTVQSISNDNSMNVDTVVGLVQSVGYGLKIYKTSARLNGLVGVGVDNPTQMLDVGGNVNIRGQIIQKQTFPGTVNISGTNINGTGTNFLDSFKPGDTIVVTVGATTEARTILNINSITSMTVSSNFTTSGSATSYTRVAASIYGNVGIGIDNPVYPLQVNGIIAPGTDNTYDLGSSSFRFKTVYAGTGSINTSDRRQKKNIQHTDLGLNFILDLKPVQYEWVNRNLPGHYYGFIAQDLEKTISKHTLQKEVAIVDHDKKSDLYGVRYTELIAPIVKAIQELFGYTEQHSREIASIKEENQNLKTELELQKQSTQEMRKALCELGKAQFCQ